MAPAISHTHHLDVSASAGRQPSIRSPKSVFVFGLTSYTALGLCNNLTERGWCAEEEGAVGLHCMHTEWRALSTRRVPGLRARQESCMRRARARHNAFCEYMWP